MSGKRGKLELYPEDLHSAALRFAKGQDRLDSISDTLTAALASSSGMAGDDDYGHRFASSYDPAAKALFRALSAAGRALGQHATGLVKTANNYLKADHHSNSKASKGGPEQYSPPPVFIDVVYPEPDSAVGPGHSSMPDVLAKYWPNGHQDKLRAAADAYRATADHIYELGCGLHQQVRSLTDNNQDDSIAAMAQFWSSVWQNGTGAGDAPLSAARRACGELANACDHFAQAIDQAHSTTEHKLAGAGIAIGFTTALGIALTPFTGGGSDVGAAALDSAEAAAILGEVAIELDAAVATISTDMIADAEVYLQAAAEGVPEVEAVDAETVAVDQTLENELAETEARIPAGTGGRGGGGFGRSGGGKPPTGGGDEPPPPEDEYEPPNLTRSERRALRSHRKLLQEHEEKLAEYIKDPDAFDNKGILKNAPPERRERIINGRIKHLNDEIREFRRQIDDILGGAQ